MGCVSAFLPECFALLMRSFIIELGDFWPKDWDSGDDGVVDFSEGDGDGGCGDLGVGDGHLGGDRTVSDDAAIFLIYSVCVREREMQRRERCKGERERAREVVV